MSQVPDDTGDRGPGFVTRMDEAAAGGASRQGEALGESGGWDRGSSWGNLVSEVITPGACTGCSGCVVVCPRGVLTLDQYCWTPKLAPSAQVDGDRSRCVYSVRGCTTCARACPRLGAWERDGDLGLHGHDPSSTDVLGEYQRICLIAANDGEIATAGQDGGVATALLLFGLERGVIDGAVVSGTGVGMDVRPAVARTRAELLAAAGSRYTYSPNLLALPDAAELKLSRLGLVSVGCQVSVPAVARARGALKLARRFSLVIGLLCSRTFTDGLFGELLERTYGVQRAQVERMNVKGRLQVWTHRGGEAPDLEVPLKECGRFERDGCRFCPDYSARHADVSLGGAGRTTDMTLAIVRTSHGCSLLDVMEAEGLISVKDALEEDPDVVSLARRMADRQRSRWEALGSVGIELDPADGSL